MSSEERSVIVRCTRHGGRVTVTLGKERVLNRNQVVEILGLGSCKNLACERKSLLNTFINFERV